MPHGVKSAGSIAKRKASREAKQRKNIGDGEIAGFSKDAGLEKIRGDGKAVVLENVRGDGEAAELENLKGSRRWRGGGT